jgi:tRNA nucleotidyltransferase (CCA-adding enzyme)
VICEILTYCAGVFRRAGFSFYAVGGAVRNPLLGLPLSDLDAATNALPQQMQQLFQGTEVKVLPKAPAFGTMELHWRGQSIECTTFRSDTYGPGGAHRPQGVHFSSTPEEDAFRRDFTVNALYQDPLSGEILDPAGGLEDLRLRRLRTTSPDPDRILRDDGLRLLRLVRFACELGFLIEKETFQSARRNALCLRDIPAERVQQELSKLLLSDIRYHAPQPEGLRAHYRALRLLEELGLMEFLFPELLEGKGISQRADYHAYDVYEHALHACEKAAPTLTLRLSALLHDVGKPRCYRETGRMLGHDQLGAQMSGEILQRLKFPKDLCRRVQLLVKKHMLDLNGTAKDATLRRHFAQMGKEAAYELAQLREADFVGSGLLSLPIPTAEKFRRILREMELQGAPFSPRELAISGEEIARAAGLAPGPRIGEIKEALFLHCAARPADNNLRRLQALARQMAKRC